jgi:hypothetical protein
VLTPVPVSAPSSRSGVHLVVHGRTPIDFSHRSCGSHSPGSDFHARFSSSLAGSSSPPVRPDPVFHFHRWIGLRFSPPWFHSVSTDFRSSFLFLVSVPTAESVIGFLAWICSLSVPVCSSWSDLSRLVLAAATAWSFFPSGVLQSSRSSVAWLSFSVRFRYHSLWTAPLL